VPIRENGPPTLRSTQSELDRRAIGAAGHFLMTGIRLERQLGSAPRLLTSLITGTVPLRPTTLLYRTSILPAPRPAGKGQPGNRAHALGAFPGVPLGETTTMSPTDRRESGRFQ
jgi:hypothetical protein